MEIAEQRQGAVTVVKPRGPLCAQDAQQLKKRLDEVLVLSLGRFVIDLSEVPFADSRGLEVLKETADELSHSGQALRVAGCNETLREVLELTDVAAGLEHYADAGAGARSFL